MANTFKFGNEKWAVGKETVLAYNDENNNFKPLPFTFDRGSTATVVNSDGLIETVGVDEPRIDFLNNTKGHLLLEPERRNEVTYSDDFSQWSATGATVTSNTTTSPDGTQNADEIDVSSDNDRLSTNGGSFTSGDTYTGSVYLKGSGTISLNVGTSSGGGVENEKSIILTNEWVRHDVTYTAPSTTGNWRLMIIRRSTDTATSAYIWGAQLEEGSYATSYIPTSGQSGGVTRSAETTTTQDNVPSTVIGQTEGTVYTEFKIYETPTGTKRIIILSDGTGNERIGISLGNGILYAFIVYGGSTQCEIVKSSFTGGTYKVAFGYKANDFVLYLNGVQVGTDNSGSVPSCNRIDLGNQFNASQLEGNIIDTKLYNTRLSNTELATLTTI